jgi:hypothetical protein
LSHTFKSILLLLFWGWVFLELFVQADLGLYDLSLPGS